LDAQVEGEGSVVAPGRLLVDLVRLLPDNEVTIEYGAVESVVHVTSGPSTSARERRIPTDDAAGRRTKCRTAKHPFLRAHADRPLLKGKGRLDLRLVSGRAETVYAR
jgi:hypothetical protein